MYSDTFPRRTLAAIAAFAILAGPSGCLTRSCSGAPSTTTEHHPEEQDTRLPMTASNPPGPTVHLDATRSGWSRLVPEQSAIFDITLRNDTSAPKQLTSLNDNDWTPVVRAYDATGHLLAEGKPRDLVERLVGDVGEPVVTPPVTVTLGPGEDQKVPVELWHFVNPLHPGRYAFEAVHTADPASSSPLSSGRIPFEVVSAGVDSCALGYESSQRLSTVLSWIAVPADTSAPELFVRASGSSHTAPQSAGRSFGPVPAGARIAVGALAPDAMTTWLGWVAVTTGAQVELLQHSLGALSWRSGRVSLPITDAVPVPRFPDRDHAVFLSTGLGGGHPALAGMVVHADATRSAPWLVPIAALPRLSACAFASKGAIAVLLVSDDGTTTHVTRLDVDESGSVVSPEHVIRTSPNEVLAATMDLRPGAPPVLLLLESNRTLPDRVALVRIPLFGGATSVLPFAPARGWPYAASRPLKAKEVALEVDWAGEPRLAFVDELGRLFGGLLDGSPLGMLRDEGHGPARCPHVGAVREQTTLAAFSTEGSLFFAAQGHGP